MGRSKFPKDLMKLIKAAEGLGWEVSWTANSHVRFRPPPGSPWPAYVTSGTASDYRAIKNCRAFLKKCEVSEQ